MLTFSPKTGTLIGVTPRAQKQSLPSLNVGDDTLMSSRTPAKSKPLELQLRPAVSITHRGPYNPNLNQGYSSNAAFNIAYKTVNV